MVKPFFRPLLHLQWKLTFSYTAITVTTLVILALAGVIVVSEIGEANFSQLVVGDLKAHASEVAPYLSAAPPDRVGVEHWLQQPEHLTTQVVLSKFPYTTYSLTLKGLLVVVDQQGTVVASYRSDSRASTALEQQFPRQIAAVLQMALAGQTDTNKLVTSLPNGTTIAAYPLLGPYGHIEGALVAQTTSTSQPSLLLKDLFTALLFTIPVAFLATIIGSIFGFFTARGFSRRFKHLSVTVDQWGQGNFAISTKDTSGDELGQLVRHLNRMAQQFQTLLHARQQLATLEERHRLARDLHDSVKQEVFTISMLVNSAKGMLPSDIERAQTCLDETDAFVQQVQQELTSLVHALYPVALKQQGLVAAVRDFVSQWSRQGGIAAHIEVQGEEVLSVREEEILYRIVQEALANVARHSHATLVEISLTREQDTFVLKIDDNGQGFDLETEQGKGIGLLSMQERMHSLGGTLLIDSILGKGTHITACYAHSVPQEVEKEFASWSRSPS